MLSTAKITTSHTLKIIISLLVVFSFQVNAKAISLVEPPALESEDNSQGNITYYASNPNAIDLWIRLTFKGSKNFKPPEKKFYALPAGAKKKQLFVTGPQDPGIKYGIALQFKYGVGPLPENIQPDTNHVYIMPYEHGTKHKVSQSYFGKKTHHKPNPYAIDFIMDIGTPVHAARGGIVFDFKEDSTTGGPHKRFSGDANYLRILHSDGTIGNYSHLKKDGVLVNLGDKVQVGDKIALSGNTGYSSGPHLHLDISYYDENGDSLNIPTLFLNYDGSSISNPSKGGFLYSTHPGKGEYKVNIGESITNEAYASFNEAVPQSDDYKLTTETFDNKVVVFIENGFVRDIKVDVKLKLKGFSSTKGKSITLNAKALSKVFVTILEEVLNADELSYAFESNAELINKTINDDEYSEYSRSVEITNAIAVRTEKVDNNVLLFVENGFDSAVNIEFKFLLNNMRASKSKVLEVKIPERTEIYLQHLMKENSNNTAKFKYSYSYKLLD